MVLWFVLCVFGKVANVLKWLLFQFLAFGRCFILVYLGLEGLVWGGALWAPPHLTYLFCCLCFLFLILFFCVFVCVVVGVFMVLFFLFPLLFLFVVLIVFLFCFSLFLFVLVSFVSLCWSHNGVLSLCSVLSCWVYWFVYVLLFVFVGVVLCVVLAVWCLVYFAMLCCFACWCLFVSVSLKNTLSLAILVLFGLILVRSFFLLSFFGFLLFVLFVICLRCSFVFCFFSACGLFLFWITRLDFLIIFILFSCCFFGLFFFGTLYFWILATYQNISPKTGNSEDPKMKNAKKDILTRAVSTDVLTDGVFFFLMCLLNFHAFLKAL